MSENDSGAKRVPVRREPPKFRPVAVARTERITPRLVRVVFTGDELEGFELDEPAASVRLLLPEQGADGLAMPEWNGNEFLLPDGERPTIRTFTPRRFDPNALELELWIVVHGDGAASQWADGAEPGAEAAISGPGRGYAVDPKASAYFLAGDETAIAAMAQLLEEIPAEIPTAVHVEIGDESARLGLPEHAHAEEHWHVLPDGATPGDALVEAVEKSDLGAGTQVWVAGEAAAVQRVRKHLRDERDLDRSHMTVRGYWKHGRAG